MNPCLVRHNTDTNTTRPIDPLLSDNFVNNKLGNPTGLADHPPLQIPHALKCLGSSNESELAKQ